MSNKDKIVHLLEKNKNSEALLLGERFLTRIPKDYHVLKLTGIAAARLGRLVDAEHYFKTAIDINPKEKDAYFQLSKVYKISNQVDSNIALLDRFLDKFPDDVRVLNEIGSLFFTKGWSDLAINCFSKAAQIRKGYREAYHNLCAVYFSIGQYQEAANVAKLAIPLCEKIDAFGMKADLLVYLVRANLLDEGQEVASKILVDFDKKHQHQYPSLYGVILNNVGILEMALNEPSRAQHLFMTAIENNPRHVDPYINIARLYAYREDFDETIKWFDRALAIDQNNVNLHEHLAAFLRSASRPELALPHHYAILEQTPESAQSLLSLGQTQFMLGDLKNAYHNYEWRWACPEGGVKPDTNLPEWAGIPVSGKSIFVYREQGIGDELIFAGALPDLLQKFEVVYCTCHPKLRSLFERSFPSIHFVTDFSDIQDKSQLEYMIAFGSLASVFRPTIDSFSSAHPFLIPDASLTKEYRQRLKNKSSRLVVGIAWRSGMKAINRQSIYPLIEHWAPIFQIPNITWVNFQYGDFFEELNSARERWGVEIVEFADIDHFNELDKSLALMKACDVLVGPSTATTMMSGAAGIPTMRIADAADEFMMGTAYYPWLSSLVPVTRKFGESWADPIEKTAAILRSLTESG